jgi:citrate lyase subunit beta / citryl-CoA lyase
MTTRLRSVLLCTPINPRHIPKSLAAGADLVVIDLEDSVETDRKAEARATVAAALAGGDSCYVRVNAITTANFEQDLAALGPVQGLAGVMLPKVEHGDELLAVDARLTRLEKEHGRRAGSIAVIPLIETALGVENLAAILLSAPRVPRISFGAGDYTLDIGAKLTADEIALAYIRARVVNASRAFGLAAPIDSVWVDVGDDAGLQASATRAQTMGFAGKLCLHPKQVATVNAAFSPTALDFEKAQRYVREFEAATAGGLAAIHIDGVLVDYPIAERARRTLVQAGLSPA